MSAHKKALIRDPVIKVSPQCALVNIAARHLLCEGGEGFVVLIRDGEEVALKPIDLGPNAVGVAQIINRQPENGQPRISIGRLKMPTGYYSLVWDDAAGLARLVEVRK